MNVRISILLAAVWLSFSPQSWADGSSPVGLWRTIDDKTAKERSLVRITETGGVLEGTVEKIFDQPGDDPQHLCRKCEGERKDKPILGMTILWGMKKDGDGYSGGEILAPKSGQIYRCRLRVIDASKKLEVRGYIGVSLFGRSQTWLKEE